MAHLYRRDDLEFGSYGHRRAFRSYTDKGFENALRFTMGGRRTDSDDDAIRRRRDMRWPLIAFSPNP